MQGWTLAQQAYLSGRWGQGEEGISQIREGLAAWQASGSEVWRPYFLALLAEMQGKVGQVEEGLKVLAEALEVVHKTEECNYEAELYRLKGELLLAQEGKRQKAKACPELGRRGKNEYVSEAEECFHKAIDITRRQSAKSLELRAATSLARLWQHQGKKEEARELLAPVYNWFTEGFDTADLKDAKALLEELS